MSLILLEGFDLYNADADVLRQWNAGYGGSLSGAEHRSGTYSWRVGGNGTYLAHTLAAAEEHATLICGFGYRHDSLLWDTTMCVFVSDIAATPTEHVTVSVDRNNAIRVTRGSRTGTTLGTSAPGIFPVNQWHYVEVKATLHDTTGAVTVKLDGVTVLTLTNVDTKNAGTKAVFDAWYLGTVTCDQGGIVGYIDDAYLFNGAGSLNNDFAGELRVQPLIPSGNGNSSQGLGSDGNSVNNYQLVDDLHLSGGTSDYVDIGTTDQQDTYAITDLTETSATIVAVQVTTLDQKTDAGVRSIAHVVRSAGADYASADIVQGTGTYVHHVTRYETDPATSAAWTRSAVNAMEAGFRAR